MDPLPHQHGAYQHGRIARTGVLIANLGTPDAPTPRAVRKFLAEFLGDPRVIEAPRWLWLPILHGVILRLRPRLSAAAYRQIWTTAGSPLLVHSRRLADAVAAALQADGTEIPVVLGMTYGNPSIPQALRTLRAADVERLLVLPLFPQYSGTSTASVFDRVTSVLRQWRWVPELRFINHYHDEPAYIEALARRVTSHWQARERSFLLFSFHGIPKSYVTAGDPYYCQSLHTARRLAEALQLADEDWSIAFQSRVGRAEWIGPYTETMLVERARAGQRRITVMCPGFATDCLETLEEIALRNREAFLRAGGESFDYIPALNADADHVELLTRLAQRHLQGWPAGGAAAARGVAEDSLRRALAKGASR